MRITVEFWNRRKYPVAWRGVRARLTGVKILNSALAEPTVDEPLDRPTPPRARVSNNMIFVEPGSIVQPDSSNQVVLEASFRNQPMDAVRPLFQITIGYFDPQRNREEELTIEHRFLYPALGWEKTDAEVEQIKKVFAELLKSEPARQRKKTSAGPRNTGAKSQPIG